MMRILMMLGLFILGSGASLSLTACHTVEGMGEDMQEVGEELSDDAGDVETEIDQNM